MIVRPGEEPRLLESRSMVLGALPEAVDVDGTLEADLQPGDRVVLYTDGITDVFDAQGEMLGVPGVQKFVREASLLPVPRDEAGHPRPRSRMARRPPGRRRLARPRRSPLNHIHRSRHLPVFCSAGVPPALCSCVLRVLTLAIEGGPSSGFRLKSRACHPERSEGSAFDFCGGGHSFGGSFGVTKIL